MEYLFFDRPLAERFAQGCASLCEKVEIVEEETPSDGAAYSVVLTAVRDDEAHEQAEALYDELFFGEQAAQIEGNAETGALADACGVQVKLSSGEFTTVAIEPEIMNKILSVLSIDELQQFLAQVAEDIEFPKNEPICKIHRDKMAAEKAR